MDTISVGALRQNPTQAINEVLDGGVVVVTLHNRPVADIVPHRKRSGATLEDLRRMYDRPRQDTGLRELLRELRAEPERDPWSEA